jgi:hypothetical protein
MRWSWIKKLKRKAIKNTMFIRIEIKNWSESLKALKK